MICEEYLHRTPRFESSIRGGFHDDRWLLVSFHVCIQRGNEIMNFSRVSRIVFYLALA